MSSYADYQRGKSARPEQSKIQKRPSILPTSPANPHFQNPADIYPDISSADSPHIESSRPDASGTNPAAAAPTDDPANTETRYPAPLLIHFSQPRPRTA